MLPENGEEIQDFRASMKEAFARVLGASYPDTGSVKEEVLGGAAGEGYNAKRLLLSRQQGNEAIPAILLTPTSRGGQNEDTSVNVAVMVHGRGKSALLSKELVYVAFFCGCVFGLILSLPVFVVTMIGLLLKSALRRPR